MYWIFLAYAVDRHFTNKTGRSGHLWLNFYLLASSYLSEKKLKMLILKGSLLSTPHV